MYSLKDYLVLDNKKISDIRFRLIKQKNEEINIEYEFIKKGNIFNETGIILKNNNDLYVHPIANGIDLLNKEKFIRSYEEIVTSEFHNDIPKTIKLSRGELNITPRAIEFILYSESIDKKEMVLKYDAEEDFIRFYTMEKKSFPASVLIDELENNVSVPRKSLSQYQIDVIEKSCVSNKELIVPEILNLKNNELMETNYDIIDNNSYILLRKRIKK